ncbi:MAG: carbamoyltransferase [Bacteriovorax sp.]|nr:carbamoyltransferase [Bacteriovorax sp.]
MYTLGLSCFYHDSAAVLLKDGQVVAAAEEERFSRKKHDSSFPGYSIHFCLTEEKITLDDIEAVVFYDKPILKFDRLLETYFSSAPMGLLSFLRSMPVWLKEKIYFKKMLKDGLKKISNGKKFPPVFFSEHHLSHAASAFYPSPFESAAILCIDGVGEWASASAWVGSKNNIKPLFEIQFPHSLGLFYSTFTGYLGFKVNSGEYKMMGLAPYGKPIYKEVIHKNLIALFDDGSFQLNLKYFSFTSEDGMFTEEFSKLFGQPPRKSEVTISQFHKDMAASVQAVTEDVVLHLANAVKKMSGEKNLVMAGGVALNCVANGVLLKSGLFDKVWVQPASGDSGGALGCALAYYHLHLKNERTVSANFQKGSLLGPAFSTAEIKYALDRHHFQYTEFKNTDDLDVELVRDHLNCDRVVGFFQGKMEFGPRALGSRSIIGDARSPKMQSIMNLAIKKRESFRPFAPIVLKEFAPEYFDWEMENESPYMLFTTQTKNKNLPAITHIDGSARLQVVDREIHPRIHALLTAFKKETGCPVLINTSFNVRGEPIVCTPIQALKCFMSTDMDTLVLENFLLKKTDQPKLVTNVKWESAYAED